jgi:hypothetical protein
MPGFSSVRVLGVNPDSTSQFLGARNSAPERSLTCQLSGPINTSFGLVKRGRPRWEGESSQKVAPAELEGTIKLQDVILKAIAKKITWMDTAEIAGELGCRWQPSRYTPHSAAASPKDPI